MSQDIVAEFMSDDEKAFFVGSLLNCGIPDHHALRSSQAGHIGVDGVRFPARSHQEHAVRRDWNARMFREFFNGSNQIGMLLAQRPELIEKRIHYQRGENTQSPEEKKSP